MSEQARHVVVVGAGPAGMALGYLLARRGVGVTVLETHHDFARAFRGEGLQQSGIDALRQMGLGDQLDRLPQIHGQAVELYQGGRLRLRTGLDGLGRGGVRLVSQPAMLQMLADEAGRFPTFRLDFGVAMRAFLRENGRVVGVRADGAGGSREYRADLVVGADGRHAATRKHGHFHELTAPQGFDLLWLKLPLPAGFPERTAMVETARGRIALAFPSADGGLQVGFVIPKGGFQELRSRDAGARAEELIDRLPPLLADHLRAHREAVAHATLLDVVCGRLTEWTAPGLLLIGDAAHPMSPVGGQGLNIALRDALVAANHLCLVLTAGGDAAAVDAAARRVQEERWPEIVDVQQMQQRQARLLMDPDGWRARLMRWMLPFLIRTGLLQRLFRKHHEQMSKGVVPVKLVV
jgi:2-polyprenyl-6-methoxyphenol hydroxylase-like FAD-dependent oxidoreductase